MYIDRKKQTHTPQKCLCHCGMNLDLKIIDLYDNHNLGTFENPSKITCLNCLTEHTVSYTYYYGTESIFRFDDQEF